jgi:hypothetical protein
VDLLLRERVCAIEFDEAGPGNDLETHEIPRSFLEEDYLLPAARTDGLHQTSFCGELFLERPGDGRERRGDQDGVVGGVLGETLCPVALDYLGVRHAEPGEVLSR